MYRRSSNSGQTGLFTLKLLAIECQKKPIFNLVQSIAPSVLIGSSSNLQVTRTDIKSGTSLNLGSEYSLWSYLPLSATKAHI